MSTLKVNKIEHNGSTPIDINGIQVTENHTPTTGSGVEIFKASSTAGQVQAFDRGGNAWMDLVTKGASLQVHTAGSERMRIDSNGNIGVNQSSVNSSRKMEITQPSDFSGALRINSALSSDNPGYIEWFSGASQYKIGINHGTDVLKFLRDTAELMRIDSSGFLHIGNSVNTQNTNRLIQMGDTSRTASYLEIRTGTTGSSGVLFSDGTTADSTGYRGTMEYSHNGDVMTFRQAATTHLRIDHDGQHSIFSAANPITARTSQGAGTAFEIMTGLHSGTSATAGGTICLRIFSNGNVQNTNNSYGQVSDIKLKENIVDAPSQWNDFKAVKFRKYNFKEETGYETHTQLGVIAQELELTSPGLVYETADKDSDGKDLGTTTKAVKSTILTQKALVALQEAMARIETLEAEVAALKTS